MIQFLQNHGNFLFKKEGEIKKIFLVITASISLLVSAVADGAEWRYITTNDIDTKFYIDVDSIKRSSHNSVKAWFKQEEKQSSKDNFSHSLLYQEFDCTEKRIRFLSIRIFYTDRKLPLSIDKTDDWVYVRPDSAYEAELHFLCSKENKSHKGK